MIAKYVFCEKNDTLKFRIGKKKIKGYFERYF